jgi:hypothetical protein
MVTVAVTADAAAGAIRRQVSRPLQKREGDRRGWSPGNEDAAIRQERRGVEDAGLGERPGRFERAGRGWLLLGCKRLSGPSASARTTETTARRRILFPPWRMLHSQLGVKGIRCLDARRRGYV